MNDVVAEGCGAALFVSHNDGEVAAIAQAFGEVGVSVLGAAGAGEIPAKGARDWPVGAKTRSGVWAPSGRGEVRVCWARTLRVESIASKIAVTTKNAWVLWWLIVSFMSVMIEPQ